MFKWICLAVGTVLVAGLAWMVNDVRLEIRRSIQLFQGIGQTVNEQLPAIVEKSQKTTDLLADNLPEIMRKTRSTVDTVSQVAGDIRSVREIYFAKDNGLSDYARSVLSTLEAAPGKIGVKKLLSSKELQNPVPAREWVASARLEATALVIATRSKKDLLMGLAKNKFGSSWYLEVEGKEPATLLDWLKANHPETAKVLSGE